MNSDDFSIKKVPEAAQINQKERACQNSSLMKVAPENLVLPSTCALGKLAYVAGTPITKKSLFAVVERQVPAPGDSSLGK